MRFYTTFLVIVLALSLVTPVVLAQSYTARLVGGREERNRFGDLLNYYIYAEEEAVVSPNPAFEIYRNGAFFPIYEPIIVDTPKESKAYYEGGIKTYTRTRSLSPQYRRDSLMNWTVMTWPEGATYVNGTNPVIAGSDNKFTIKDWIFSYRGRYNIRFDVTLWNGDKMRFNRTITVDQQPAVVALTTSPEGYNGSSLFPIPVVQLQNLIQQKVKSSTATITFVIVSGPAGGINKGEAVYKSNADGGCELNKVILSLPGTYVFRIEANLSNHKILTTRSYSIAIEKALPTLITLLTSPYGISQFLLFTQPKFQVYDQAGIIHDDRTNMTLRIASNNPSFSYENQLSYATLMGTTSVLPVNYAYTFNDIWLDMPGGYTIEAILMLDGEEFLIFSFSLTVDSPPTYLITSNLQINTIGNITIYGRRPVMASASPMYFAISQSPTCSTVDSSIVLWNETNPSLTERSVSIVPYVYGSKLYFCMKTNNQPYFSKLIQLYLQRFSEPFPYLDSFPASDVSECVPLGGIMASMYHSVGWTDAKEGRHYGCRLVPPVAGTVAPCDCPPTLRCTSYTSKVFRPPGLDIGQCVCCTGWVMGVAGTAAAISILAVLVTIYLYV